MHIQHSLRSTGCLVDFVIIGAMKSGTTHLYSLMWHHPGLVLSSIKEPRYFSHDPFQIAGNPVGNQWYESLFAGREGLRGEASTSYTKDPSDYMIAQRMVAANPRIKAIYLIRNPVDRCISHYFHNVLSGRERQGIREALLNSKSKYLAPSRYFQQLQPYISALTPERIIILPCELLKSAPRAVLAMIYKFLEISPIFPPIMPVETHTFKSNIGRYCGQILQEDEQPVQSAVREALRAEHAGQPLTSAMMAERVGFSAQDRYILESYFAQECILLAEYLSKDNIKSCWSTIPWLSVH